MPDPIPLRPGFKEWWSIYGEDIYAALVAVYEGEHPDAVWERLNAGVTAREHVGAKFVTLPDAHGRPIDVMPLHSEGP